MLSRDRGLGWLILVALVGFCVCAVLLLDITAPNPTRRRASSQPPTTTGEGSTAEIGLSGEAVLARDLGLPRNEAPDQRVCFCGPTYTPSMAECRSCLIRLETITAHRRPDFVSANFIAEAKNRQRLLAYPTDLNQIRDFADAARALGVPLWLYVRVDTLVEPEIEAIVRATGGQVVYYFATPGYVDPVRGPAAAGMLGFAVLGAGAAGLRAGHWPALPRRRRRRRVSPAQASVDNARQHVDRMKAKGAIYRDDPDDAAAPGDVE